MRKALWDKEFINPNYNGKSIVNLPISILKALNCKVSSKEKELKGFEPNSRTFIILVTDSVGYNLFSSFMLKEKWIKKVLKNAKISKITSTFPPTTTTALASIVSGMHPGEHGLVGYTMLLREFGLIANMIDFSPVFDTRRDLLVNAGLNIDEFLGGKTIFERLGEEGIESYVITKFYLRNSALSKLLHNGAKEVTGYFSISDLFTLLRRHVDKVRGKESVTFAYWEAVDTLSHVYSPISEEVYVELKLFFKTFYEDFLLKIKKSNISLIIIGDHGHTNLNENDYIDANNLLRFLRLPPAGSSRATYLYIKKNADEVISFIKKKYKAKLVPVKANELIKKGLLGKMSKGLRGEEIENRIGDVVVLSKKHAALRYIYRKRQDEEMVLRGHHGGLTDDEMFVPLIQLEI
jgi:predicted AlkP superfamily pyrophosphatase or phosphodiesterase